MIDTGNELELSDCLLLLNHVATVVSCTEVLFQTSFSFSRSTRYLWNMRYTTRWLWYGLGELSMLRVTETDTARTETERAPTSPDETHLHDSRLYRAQKTNAHHPRMDRPILCCLCTYSTRCS